MKRYLHLILGLIISGCVQTHQGDFNAVDPGRSTVKIQALSHNGKQNLGSGVVIAQDTVATNCHVTRQAERAIIILPEGLYPVLSQAALPEYDVCILKTADLTLTPAELTNSNAIQIGDDIVLSGYPFALGLRMKRGKVTGLFPYDQDQIIEINAGFNHGASGGGVFDREGKLIGLMTFMGPEADAYHFYAIPAAWLAMGLEQDFKPLKPFSGRSFWEKGYFAKPKK